jgi:hypothetical protein
LIAFAQSAISQVLEQYGFSGSTVVVKGRHFVEFRPAATALTIVQA